jgi:hypothetical protein
MSLVKHNNIWKRIETIKVRRDGAWVDYTSVYAWYSKDSISAWYEIDIDATPVGPAINVWQIYADDPDADTLEEVGLSFLSLDKPFIGFLSGQSETLENQADLERLVTTLDDVAAFKWSKVEGKQGEKGEDGSFVSFIFRNAINQPNTPTGGTYDGSVETFPDNTTDRPNFTNGLITWVSKTRYYKLGNAWSNNGWSEFSEYVIKGGKGDKGEGGDAAPEKFSWTVYSDSQTSGAIYTSNDPRRLFIGVVHNNSTINPATGPNDHGIYTWSLGLNVIDLRESDYLFNKLGADNINVTELFAEQILASGFIKYQGASQASVILGGESTGPLFQTKNTNGVDSFTISRAGSVSFDATGIRPGTINFNALSQQAIESLVGQTGTPTPDSGGSKSVSFEASAAISKTLDILKHGSNTIKLSVYGSMSRNSSTPNGDATARVTVNEKIGNGSFQEARTDLVTAGEFQDGDTYWVDWNYDVEFTRNPTADNDVTYEIVLSAFNNWGPFKGAFSLIAEETAVGSGGGGSSDELDGQNGAYYLNYDNFTGRPNVQEIKFGAGAAVNDEAHIEWLGGNNAGFLRFSTSDDSGSEYMQFGDYDNGDKGGAFTQWLQMYRGQASFNGNVSASTFTGNLTGNASSAGDLLTKGRVDASTGRSTKGDLTHYSSYTKAGKPPGMSYPYHLQATSGREGFEIAADWISQSPSRMAFRTLRDTTDNWSNWVNIYNDNHHPQADNATKLNNQLESYYDQRRYNLDDNFLGGYYSSGGPEKPNDAIFGKGKLKLAMLNSSQMGFSGDYWQDVLWISAYNGGDVKSSSALAFSKGSGIPQMHLLNQNYDSASWGTAYQFLHSGNWKGYAPTKTGEGASGNWNIRAERVYVRTSSDNNFYDVMWNAGENIYSSPQVEIRPSDGYFRAPTIQATTLKVGNGDDGYFFSDTNGRTAFKGGDFYIQDIPNAYNYAARNHHGASSGCEQLFRGNKLYGNNWSIETNGKIYGIDCVATSDRRLKDKLVKITDPIGKLSKINGYTFEWLKNPGERVAHTMAQEVRKVYPEAVKEDTNGRLSVSLTAEIALLVEVCKSQQNDIEKQQYIIQKQQYNIEDMQRRIYKLENK